MKFGKEVVLSTTDDNSYRTTKLSVTDCESPEDADKELRRWIKRLGLEKIKGNEEIINNTLLRIKTLEV